MKNVKTLIAAAVLSSLSFASFAAVQVQSTPLISIKSGRSLRLPGLTWVHWKISWRKKRKRWVQNLTASPL
jgi:hypothetical protein